MEFPKSQSAVTLDVIVVGAGLGGLGAAISSALSGHKVTVFEAAKELQEVGAGLQITPNASRLLEAWSLPESLWASAAEPTSLTVHRYDGKVLSHSTNFNKDIRARYKAPFIDLHRVDLHRALYARALSLGISFRLGSRVMNAESRAATPSVTLQSGETVSADLVVAADGLWSACRSAFVGRADPPRPTGDLAYRVVLDAERHLQDDPELYKWVTEPAVHFWIGPGAHAVGYSLRAGRMYNIVLLVPDDLPEGVSRTAGSVEEMRALFGKWDPILGRFLSKVEVVDKWKLMHRPEMPHWVNEQGNFVFLGDACHPMLPYLAQGANSALEDGAVLGLLLGHIKTKDQLPQALQLYEKLRKARGDAIARETFKQASNAMITLEGMKTHPKQRHDFHLPDGPEQQARDDLFLSQLGQELKGPFPSRWQCPEVQPWLYGYDAQREVEEAVKAEPFV